MSQTLVERLAAPIYKDAIDGLKVRRASLENANTLARNAARCVCRRYWQRLDVTMMQDIFFQVCIDLADDVHEYKSEQTKADMVNELARVWQAEYEDYIERMLLG